MPWSARFLQPIFLTDGRKLETLYDAASYVTELSETEQDAAEWQTAMATLLLVAEHDGPIMMAHISMMRALNRHRPKAKPAPRQKRSRAYKIIR
jgi:hypothetical protein